MQHSRKDSLYLRLNASCKRLHASYLAQNNVSTKPFDSHDYLVFILGVSNTRCLTHGLANAFKDGLCLSLNMWLIKYTQSVKLY